MPTNKYFKCPYCGKSFTREDLVNHIGNKHENELPAGFTPLRMVFHVVNRKPLNYTAPCRICKGPTDWDENKGRYNFLCNKPSCKKAWIEKMKQIMGDKMGSNRPTATPEGLEKMLANRKISGKYKFSDGTEFTYTGSYELECLKFMDQVLNIKSEDLQVPGPIIKYPYKDGTHIYIPDFYYIPYNLIIEVKDGGNNPNRRTMEETRARQMAKEEYVIKHTDYNYIRLTDNNFGQLITVFADLKMHLIEHNPSKVAHVNENMAMGAIAPMVGFGKNDLVVVNRGMNNVFSGKDDYAISDSPKLDNLIYRDSDGILRNLKDKKIVIHDGYKSYIIRNKKDKVIESVVKNINKFVDEQFIYETVFGHKSYSNDQIQFESGVEEYDYYKDLKNIQESVSSYIHESSNKVKDIQSIIDSLSKEEKANIGDDTTFDDSHTIKKIVKYDGKIPVAYFDIDYYKSDKSLNVSLAVRKDYQGKGYGKVIAKEGSDWVKSHKNKFTTAYWATKPNNTYSQKLAEDNGWKLVRNDKEWKTYAIDGSLKLNESFITEAKAESQMADYQDNLVQPIESRWGIVSDDGAYNCCIKVKNYEKPMRGRSSMIVIRKINGEKCVFFKKGDKDEEYHAPGGGWNKEEDPKDAAIREAREEAHINVKDVEHCGVRIEYYKQVRKWVKEHVANPKDWWYGYYSEIYVGRFDSFYKGHINKMDEDPEIYSGEWYPIKKIIDDKKLYPEYRDAIKMWLKKRGETI